MITSKLDNTEVVKEISEPVRSIIKSIEKYPGRWKVRNISGKSSNLYATEYTCKVRDVRNKITAECHVVILVDWNGLTTHYHMKGDFSWLTDDEIKLLDSTLTSLYDKKKSRMKSIKEAGHKRQREMYKEIYK